MRVNRRTDMQDVSTVPGVADMYWHVGRMVEMKGDRNHPDYIEASKLVSRTRQDILDFMRDNELDAILGDLQLSLMSSYSNSTYVSSPCVCRHAPLHVSRNGPTLMEESLRF